METECQPEFSKGEAPADTKKRWATPQITVHGKVPEENPARAALGRPMS